MYRHRKVFSVRDGTSARRVVIHVCLRESLAAELGLSEKFDRDSVEFCWMTVEVNDAVRIQSQSRHKLSFEDFDTNKTSFVRVFVNIKGKR